MFGTPLTPEQREAVQQAWLDLEAIVNVLPPSALTTLLSFHIRNLLDELNGLDGLDGADVEIDIGAVHTATSRVNALAEGGPFISDMKGALKRANQVLHTLITE